MDSDLIRNRGYVRRTIKGYQGELNIDNVRLDIDASFWDNKDKGNFIWVQRKKIKVYSEKTTTFVEKMPTPIINIFLFDTNKEFPQVSYKGNFTFIGGFCYEIAGKWESREKKKLLFSIERAEKQPIIDRLKEIRTERNYE